MTDFIDAATGEVLPNTEDNIIVAFAARPSLRGIKHPPRNASWQFMIDTRTMPEPNSGCWLWLGEVDYSGYARLSWKGEMTRGHRVSWEHFKGPIPPGLYVLHKCDVRSCCNPDHLFVGTHADNMADRKKKGRYLGMKGIAHPRAKLSEDDVRLIRATPRNFGSGTKLARQFGVDSAIIYRIWNGTLWGSVL